MQWHVFEHEPAVPFNTQYYLTLEHDLTVDFLQKNIGGGWA